MRRAKKDITQDKKATTQDKKDILGTKRTKQGHSGQKGQNESEQNFSLPASTCTSKETDWQGTTRSRNGQKENVGRTGHFANTCMSSVAT